MAKYRLTTNPKKSVNCEVLHENNNGYIVRFDNGMIKNVRKSNVYALNKIDEAVIDSVRQGVRKFGDRVIDVAKKVVARIKELFGGIVKVGNFIFFKNEEGGLMSASHPINAMEAASSAECACVNYLPNENDIKLAEELGIEPVAVENFEHSGEYCGAINFDMSRRSNESQSSSFIDVLVEASDSGRWLTDKEKIHLEGEFGDWTQEQIENDIINEYAGRYTEQDSIKGVLPLMVWGAPGIGKTSIMRACKNKIKSQFKLDIRVISINGGSVGYDDFTMPADVKEALITYLDGKERRSEIHRIDDLPKTWLPVHNPNAPDAVLQNAIANGGYVEEIKDSKGNVIDTKVHNGPGGIFFIDEFSRLTQAAMSSLMQTPTSREIGSNSNLKFGDRWVIVCAANRKSDMATNMRSRALDFEGASKTRFRHVNFVPKVEDWLNWANELNSNGEPNVLPEIVNYIASVTAKGERKDFYEMYSFPKGELNVDRATACPRTWEAFSASLRSNFLKRTVVSKNGEDFSLFQAYYDKKAGSLGDVDVADIKRCGEGIIGGDPTARFINFLNEINFTDDDAESVVLFGDKDPQGKDIKYDIYDKIKLTTYNNLITNTVVPLIVKHVNAKGGITDEMLLNIFKFGFVLSHVPSNASGKKVFTLSIFNKFVGAILRSLGIKFDNSDQSRFVNAHKFHAKVTALKG